MEQNMKKIRFHLLAYFIKSAESIFIIGSYINVFHWNGHVAIYFRQFYADKGPKLCPKYGDVWWFWANCSTFSCTLLLIHVITESYLTLFTTQDVSLIKNMFEHGEVAITWSINPLFATTHNLRFLYFILINTACRVYMF